LVAQGTPFLRIDTNRLGTPRRYFGFYDGTPILRYDDCALRPDEVSAVWARRFVNPNVLDLAVPKYRNFIERELADVMEAFFQTAGAPCMNSYEADRTAGNRLRQAVLARSVVFLVPENLLRRIQPTLKTLYPASRT
jgi:hypothetical protein